MPKPYTPEGLKKKLAVLVHQSSDRKTELLKILIRQKVCEAQLTADADLEDTSVYVPGVYEQDWCSWISQHLPEVSLKELLDKGLPRPLRNVIVLNGPCPGDRSVWEQRHEAWSECGLKWGFRTWATVQEHHPQHLEVLIQDWSVERQSWNRKVSSNPRKEQLFDVDLGSKLLVFWWNGLWRAFSQHDECRTLFDPFMMYVVAGMIFEDHQKVLGVSDSFSLIAPLLTDADITQIHHAIHQCRHHPLEQAKKMRQEGWWGVVHLLGSANLDNARFKESPIGLVMDRELNRLEDWVNHEKLSRLKPKEDREFHVPVKPRARRI